MKFDPEPLGFVEKRSEEGFVGRGTEEAKAWSDRERGGAELFVARTCKEGPRTNAINASTERDGNWPKATEQVGVAEP